MGNSTFYHRMRSVVPASVLLILFAGSLAAQTAIYPGYPPQVDIFTEPPLVRPDLQSVTRPASPAQVSKIYGLEFASLPRLGVVLILVINKGRQNAITVSRQTVRLTLPDGTVLKALQPSEMISWLQETHGSALGKKTAHDAIFGDWTEQERLGEEKGLLTVPRGKAEGKAMVFRFPEGIRSGQFSVEYVLDLGADGQMPVKQGVPLNLRP